MQAPSDAIILFNIGCVVRIIRKLHQYNLSEENKNKIDTEKERKSSVCQSPNILKWIDHYAANA